MWARIRFNKFPAIEETLRIVVIPNNNYVDHFASMTTSMRPIKK